MARTEVTGLQIKDGSVSLTADVVGILPVANGGTGSDTLALNNVLLGNGTGALQAVAPGTAGNVLTSNGTTWTSSAASVGIGNLTGTTAQFNTALSDNDFATLAGTETLTNKTIQLPRPDSIYSTDASLVNTYYIGNNDAGRFPYFSPVPKYLWHDILRFSRFTGAPTYETYNGTTWSSQTLNTEILSGKEATAYALTNGTTTTGARWTWSSGNLSYSYLRWWVIGLGYVGATAPINSFLVESSPDGTTWTTRHTSTVTSQGTPVWLYASDHGGHNRLRLTIVTTNAQAINVSGIKGLSSRWANQGGGVEYEFPYDWDGSRNITTLANLTVGSPGTSSGSAVTVDATQTLTSKTLTSPAITTPTGIVKGDVGLGSVDNTADAAKAVLSATKLTTARTINGVSFDGSANITVADSTKEPTITAGTTAQYFRGDKSFQTLNADAVPDGTTNKAFLATEKTKLTGIATGATANSTDATLLARTNHTGTQLAATISDFSTAADARVTAGITGKENTSNKGIANGYASLDSGGKVPVAQLPNSIMEYQGTWNASTNTPTLANGTGSAGDVYRVSVAGTALSLTFEVGDYAIYNGSTWEKSDTTDAVASVAGRTGNVTLTSTDVGLANVDNTSDATKNAAAVALTNKTSITSTGVVTGTQLVSTVATGTAPFTVASTTNVANLNASYLQGYVGNTGAVASTFALRDANANLAADNFINTVDSTVTAAGTTTLTAASAGVQVFTGTTTQTVLMPTGVVWAGQKWTILNQSTGALAIQSSTGAAMFSLPAGYAADVTCLFNTPTTALHWRGTLWAQTAGVIPTTSNSLAAFAQSTTNTIGVGNIELGHATDTTLSRSAAGTLAVEGVNVVMTGGALGTPSSGTLTNCTFPTLNQNTTGSAATLTTARTIGGVSFNGSANIDLPGVNTAGTQNTSGTAAGLSTTLAVGSGGTGSTTLTLNNVLLGNGTSALQAVAPGTTGNVLTSNGTTWTSAAPTGGGVSRVTSTITTATTLGAVANTEYLAYIASGGSVTLPTAVGNTSLYTLKNTDTTTKTIATQGDDASFASVTALVQGNGVDASTVFTDSAVKYAWAGTANVRLSTAVKKFGTASIYFGAGGNNANITAPALPGMGTSDFTIEMWFYSTVAAPANGYYFYDTRPFGTNGVYTTMYVASTQKVGFLVGGVARITGTTNVTTNTWHHVALSRSAGVTRMFLNGVQEGGDYTDTNNYVTNVPIVGNTGAIVNGVWAGYLDDIRITQGVGRYTSGFAVPTAEFPVPQLIDGTYPLVLAPNQAIELASSGSNWSLVSDAAPIPALTTTPTSATTTTLTVASTPIQVFTGTTTHTVKLPSTGIVAGRQFTVINNSTGLLTMQTSTAAQIHVLASGTESILTALIDSPTTAAHWEDSFIATNFAAGKALTVNNTLTLAGTDGTSMTFPGASDTVVTLAAAQTLTNKTLTTPTLTTPVINSTPTGTGVATAATASTLALRDANANITADNFINAVDSTVTAAGTTTLTIASGGVQVFTGTTTQNVLLPTTSVTAGMSWTIINNSTGAVLVASSAGNTVATVSPSTAMVCTALVATPTTAAHWTASATSDATRRIVPRSISTASTATPSINSDTTDFYYLTALAVAITAITITGTPVDGQQLTLRFKDNGTARAIAWSSAFTSSGVAVLPTTTVANKTHLIGLMYDSQAAKWVCVASDSTGY